MKYIGAIDQGTTSTRFILFDHECNVIASHQMEHKQYFPKPGWVEHDALEIWQNTQNVIISTLENAHISTDQIAGIGITNQRETSLLWNRQTGLPYHNALVWQDTRTENYCQHLDPQAEFIKQKTGLPLATYFSASKIRWLLDNIPNLQQDLALGDVLFGNIDSWLLWKITGEHKTDVTNASRTMLMDLEQLDWDDQLLEIFDIPRNILPQICSSSEIYGYSKTIFDSQVPICGILGDQQAALFGQTCFQVGEAKNTYGTGCFLLLNSGEKIVRSQNGLLTTVAYKLGNNPASYALEGSIAIAGSLVQWVRDNFGIIQKSEDINQLAEQVEDNGGVYFVPAFSGLFAPYWDDSARGTIVGLTHYANKSHLARAVLESTAFQAHDVFNAMQKNADVPLKNLKVDGGMTASKLLMQFQADLLEVDVIRPKITETTALGAAFTAGLAIKFWQDRKELKQFWKIDQKYSPQMKAEIRDQLLDDWSRAVEKSKNWI